MAGTLAVILFRQDFSRKGLPLSANYLRISPVLHIDITGFYLGSGIPFEGIYDMVPMHIVDMVNRCSVYRKPAGQLKFFRHNLRLIHGLNIYLDPAGVCGGVIVGILSGHFHVSFIGA